MSEMSVKAREAAKRKVERLTTDPHQKVDASSWTPPEPENANIQTGPRPISKRQFRKGGLVVSGEHEHKRADRKPRKSGGRALVDDYVNRDVKEANEERPGTKHVGGMKRGGAAHKDEAEDKKLIHETVKRSAIREGHAHGGSVELHHPDCRCHKCMGGEARARGGETEMHHESCRCHKCGGGRVHRDNGGFMGQLGESGLGGIIPMLMSRKTGGSVSDGTLEGTRPEKGGRFARKSGGRADAHWIKGAIKHPGALHRELNVADDKRIPEKKLAKAEHSPNKLVAKRAHLADTLEHMHREGRKHGGKTGKGKMNVNIVIAPGGGGQPQGAPMPAQGMPPPRPIIPPQVGPQGMPGGGMPPGAGAPPPMAGPPSGMPPPGAGMMPRKRGGAVEDKLAKLSAGAGGGLSRLEKKREYGAHQV